MSLLFDTVYRSECTSTHHKLALDALRHFRGKQADAWRQLFVRYYEDYLEGAKAPDKQFRDFRNHVLHVGDNYWGGAIKTSLKWYERTVESLGKKDWSEGVYCAGVLSHYYTDPLMPFHTGQTEEEGKVHRAAEWSVCKSYDEILRLLPADGYPELETPNGDQWLTEMVKQAAEASHQHYQLFVDQYDLEQGVKNPRAGLNEQLRQRLAELFGHAIIGLSRILERAFQDAQVKPPHVRVGLMGLLTRLTSPFGKFNQFREGRKDRQTVRRIHREFRRTGCVIKSLPPDDRQIRQLHAEEVLGVTEAELNQLTIERAKQQLQQQAAGQQQRRAEAKTERKQAAAAKKAEQKQSAAQKKAEQKQAAEQRKAQNRADQQQKAEQQKADQQQAAEKQRVARETSQQAAKAEKQQQAEKIATVGTQQPRAQALGADAAGNPPAVQITATAGLPREATLKFYLERHSPVVDAPSIGAKTARRLAKLGVQTVDDLLGLEVEQAAQELDSGYITADTLRSWQAQAALVCRIPNLRGHDAQMLQGSQLTDPQLIANMAPGELLDRVENFLISEEGERVLRVAREPDRAEVTNWIRWSQQARKLSAA